MWTSDTIDADRVRDASIRAVFRTNERRLFHALLGMLLNLGAGCNLDRTDTTPVSDHPTSVMFRELPLIDHEHWQEYVRADDPLVGHQPTTVDCGPAGWYVEPSVDQLALEIDTKYCNYALLEHPSARAIAAGARVRMEVRHYDLFASQPAAAHLAVILGSELAWEAYIPIPSAAEVRVYEWAVQKAFPAGEPIRLHLHNHGQNTWVIGALTVLASSP